MTGNDCHAKITQFSTLVVFYSLANDLFSVLSDNRLGEARQDSQKYTYHG